MKFTARGRIGWAVAAAVVCLALLGGWYRARAAREFSDPRAILSRFPQTDAAVMMADFALLRHAGLLTESKAALEPEYKSFLDGTGFDYRRDLDSVTAAFSPGGNYYIARGRFDWAKLREYVRKQGGSCYQDLCRVQGSSPERRISFLPLRDDTIALAVSNDDLAATRLTKAGPPVTGTIPASPVWISIPGAAMRQPTALPPSMRTMFSALRTTERLVFLFQPSGGEIEARMEATCKTTVDAGVLASQLRLTTSALREAFKEQQDELAAALMAGTFEENGERVTGRWPLRRSLMDSLTAGI